MLRRIKRDYRQRRSPAKFLSICQKIKVSLTNNANYPASMWGANETLLQQFFEMVARLEVAFHLSINGDRVLIRERDKLIEEMMVVLDEIALLLEAASRRNPDALFTTGFSVTQERRSTNRTRLPLVAPTDFVVVNSGEIGKALASASHAPGAFNHEIHINTKDPAVEAYWGHFGMFPDSQNMIMENINGGNAFFRVRHHGPEGAGPWSATVSVVIT